MKKLLIGTALATSVAASAFAGGHGKEVTIGVFLGLQVLLNLWSLKWGQEQSLLLVK